MNDFSDLSSGKEAVKRKAGFSLVNPGIKRHSARGAKIGENCSPPNLVGKPKTAQFASNRDDD